MKNIFFVSGIDTGAGKTFATGWLAREWRRDGVRAITQKPVQTGIGGDVSPKRLPAVSEKPPHPSGHDIAVHREIMGCGFLPEDFEGLTAPVNFPYPASPHLSAKLAGAAVDFGKIDSATLTLAEHYDAVLIEGAGGLMSPLSENYLTIEFIRERNYPVIFVTSGKLGSINHTLLSLDALRARGIRLHTLLFNEYPESDPVITADTERFLRQIVARDWPGADFIKVPIIQTS